MMDLPTAISVSVGILTAGGVALKVIGNRNGTRNSVSMKEFIPRIELNGKFADITRKFKRVVFDDDCKAASTILTQRLDLTFENLSDKIDQNQKNLNEKIDQNQQHLKELFKGLKEEIRNNGNTHKRDEG